MQRLRRLRGLLLMAATALVVASASAADTNAPPEQGPELGSELGSELGKEVFTAIAQPPCGACHTLADAGTAGTTGPNLDEQKPSEEDAKLMVTEGAGVMPGYGPLLTEEQIDAVAKYVSRVAGQTN
jgi:mono/diheme cytochrome c family protein